MQAEREEGPAHQPRDPGCHAVSGPEVSPPSDLPPKPHVTPGHCQQLREEAGEFIHHPENKLFWVARDSKTVGTRTNQAHSRCLTEDREPRPRTGHHHRAPPQAHPPPARSQPTGPVPGLPLGAHTPPLEGGRVRDPLLLPFSRKLCSSRTVASWRHKCLVYMLSHLGSHWLRQLRDGNHGHVTSFTLSLRGGQESQPSSSPGFLRGPCRSWPGGHWRPEAPLPHSPASGLPAPQAHF